MHIKRLIYSDFGNILIPVILGFGLASLFRKVCKERNCIVFKAPSLDEIEEKTFKYNGVCYRFTHQAGSCDNSKKTVEFA